VTDRRTITGRVVGYVWSIRLGQPEKWLFFRWAFRRGAWTLHPLRAVRSFRGRREAEAFALAALAGAAP